MITIDGSQGEGGGQILRSSLALAICTQRAVKIKKIRAKRSKPGLMRQHLTAVLAAVEISNAKVEGAAIGSQEISFSPGAVKPGDYTFSVGTAGSSSLVLQTILPPLLTAPAPTRLILEGGTHNPFAPPYDFIEQAFLPLLNRMGVNITVNLERYGFYPAGGGRWTVTIEPAEHLQPLQLLQRGAILQQQAIAVRAGIPGHIAERELKVVAEMLGWGEEQLLHHQIDAKQGPGNCLNIILRSAQVCEVFTGFGRQGVPAERVAKDCVRKVRRYLAADIPVGEYLADQLMLPMALAGGGKFYSLAPSRHTMTNAEIIKQFLPMHFGTEQLAKDKHLFKLTMD